ncbi:protein TIC 40, chloroplastic-like [Carya illinoinensis]|uniref:protein TIC 40, chloroplastic-like n=1 Tax=Carya illinoinensis TaxID=32201 RepID=UPI001C72753F|nr:protein TIC 40, chloroplastic-like [Carya illinoinensis]
MMSTKFLIASTAPPPSLPHPEFHRQVEPGFLIFSRVFSFRLNCLHRHPQRAVGRVHERRFASISSSTNQGTTSVGTNPQVSVLPPPSGSPLFWIGAGVGLSALFSWVAMYLKKYAMQQAFKTLMGQMNSQNNQFNNAAFPSGSPFPFPMPSTPVPSTSTTPAASRSAVTVDVPATNVEATPATIAIDETEVKRESKKPAFADVSPEEAEQKSPYESFKDVTGTSSSKDTQTAGTVSQNGAASKPVDGSQWSKSTSTSAGFEGTPSPGKSILSVEALEKMMEDPAVQKLVYPNNMMSENDSFKNFDLNSPELKQQFDQIGHSPEEAFVKIMADPELRLAFQNPRIQAAIMECSQNPLSISKYQNDKEVMDLFNKISELFPVVSGPP